jgi:glycosyltransferase involved in cell wall biosynthesis
MSAPATTVPVIVAARNEERSLGATLAALVAARDHAAKQSSFRFEIVVVLDETTDASASIVERCMGVRVVASQGGKVEAQRAGLRLYAAESPPFSVFCDADVRPSAGSLLALASLLASRPEVEVATCPLRPLPPRRSSPLAAALYTYNLRRGFSSSRTWFNGKLFAMRTWDVPSRAELEPRIRRLAVDPFYDFDEGLLIDDVYLSRVVVREHGPRAIAETATEQVEFRAPETWRGMNRYYRRMRRELERLDRLFPETRQVHVAHGRRAQDLLAAAPVLEKVHHALFRVALAGCQIAYVVERAWVRHVRRRPRAFWPPIAETKA